ncbi:MAG: glycyl-radical enzyme activating protein [Clostridiales bacterium]|nr:glycyl-radical enzyme activating protein [Clostridiales bacterium]
MRNCNCNDGYIMQMQNFSVNDGDGIRTTIFLYGCPLHCIWCCNPENAYCPEMGMPSQDELTNIMPEIRADHRTEVAGDGREIMPQTETAQESHHMTLDKVDKKISRQALFYRGNGGGITFSGGEATVQQGFLRAMVNRFYDKGYDLSLETCGAFSFDEVKDILQKMSRIFIDLKLFDNKLHRLFTGVSNAVILKNIRRTAALRVPVVVRIPVIVGVNAFEENIEATCAFLEDLQESCLAGSSMADGQESGVADISLEFLPYHRYGMDKYTKLGIPDPDARYEMLREQAGICWGNSRAERQMKLRADSDALQGMMDMGSFPGGFSFAERMEIPSEELLERYREIAAAHHIRTVSFR